MSLLSVCNLNDHSAFAVTASTFSALELLGDHDDVPEQWILAQSKKKLSKDKARGHDPDVAISVARSSNKLQTNPESETGYAMARKSGTSLSDDAASDESEIQKSAHAFMQLVRHKGRSEHHWLVNALNPATQYHESEVRAAYKALHKSAQQRVWKLLAGATPMKLQQAPASSTRVLSPSMTAPSQTCNPTASNTHAQAHKVSSPDLMSTACGHFLCLLQRYGVSSQATLTNVLNPSSASHVPAIRDTFKALSKKDSKLAWHMLPAQMPRLPTAAVAFPKASRDTLPASPLNTRGQRVMSRMGSRPVPGCRPAPGSRPVPRSRPISASSHQMADAMLQDPIPEEPDATLQTTPYGIPTWVFKGQCCGQDDESRLCCVCLDQPRDAMLIPCNHAVTCISCAIMVKDKTGQCPYCRAAIQNVLCVH